MTLTKDSIIDSVQEKAGIPRQKSKELVETLFEIIKWNINKNCFLDPGRIVEQVY